jgi:hypothetical protein
MTMNKPIRFLRHWRGRNKGDLNDQLLPGVRDQLVRRGIAEWFEPAVVQVPKRRVKEQQA